MIWRVALAAGLLTSASLAWAGGAGLPAGSGPTAIPPVPEILTGNKGAFDAAVAGQLPLTPDQIRSLRRRAEETGVAMHDGPPPKMSSPSIAVSFAPGAPIPVVAVSPGFVTNIQFLGVDGTPWRIVSATVGNPSWFSVVEPASHDKDAPANVVTVSALTMSAASNLSVLLKGAPSAISVTLVTSVTSGYATATLRMDRMSPDAVPQPMISRAVGQATGPMLSFLDGIAPAGAVALASSDSGVQVWRYQARVYVRTRFDLLSPAWNSVINTPDGTHLYEMSDASVLLASVNGQVRQIVVKSAGGDLGGQ